MKMILKNAGKLVRTDSAIFRKKSVVLTHCNTGKLATAGEGTAFSVIKSGFEKELVTFVYADETRPLLARFTFNGV